MEHAYNASALTLSFADSVMTEPTNPPAASSPGASALETWRTLRQKRWFAWGVDLSIALMIFAAISAWQTRSHLDDGVMAPDFSLISFDEPGAARTTLEGLRGKKTVLFFWAPWCTVCDAESSTISALQASHGDEINVRSVVLGYEDHDSIRAFMSSHEVDYPVLLGQNTMTTQWHIEAFPTIYLLDSKGHIASSVVGYTTRAGLLARLATID
jgi:thiol-disulfide isomerase/thioredoxin